MGKAAAQNRLQRGLDKRGVAKSRLEKGQFELWWCWMADRRSAPEKPRITMSRSAQTVLPIMPFLRPTKKFRFILEKLDFRSDNIGDLSYTT